MARTSALRAVRPGTVFHFCPITRGNVDQAGCHEICGNPHTSMHRCHEEHHCGSPFRYCWKCQLAGKGKESGLVADADKGLCEGCLHGKKSGAPVREVHAAEGRSTAEVAEAIKFGKAKKELGDPPLPAGELRYIPYYLVDPLPNQPRTYFNEEKIRLLAESIAADGQVTPAVVAPKEGGRFQLIDGERRLKACTLKKMHLLAVVVEKSSYEDELKRAIVANLHREGHTPLEQAVTMRRLRDECGLSVADIARIFGCTDGNIYHYLIIIDKLPTAVLDLMDPEAQEGKRLLGATAARGLTAFNGHPAEQLQAAKHIVSAGLSINETRRYLDKLAESLGVTSGRGREKKSADHIKNLKSAMRGLASRLEPFVKMNQADVDNLFAYSPASNLIEVQDAVEARLRDLRKLALSLKKVEHPGCKRGAGDAK